MNEARKLGTCTDMLTRQEKGDSLALSSTASIYAATTYEGMPRDNIVIYSYYIISGMPRSIHQVSIGHIFNLCLHVCS